MISIAFNTSALMNIPQVDLWGSVAHPPTCGHCCCSSLVLLLPLTRAVLFASLVQLLPGLWSWAKKHLHVRQKVATSSVQ